MRAWVIALMLVGCGNKEDAPKQQAAAPAPTPADAATGCLEIDPAELAPEQIFVNDIAWRSPTQLVVAIGGNPHTFDPSKARPEHSGIALYDMNDPTPVTYRMPADQVELMGSTALVVGGDYVTRFELDTACVRQSTPVSITYAAIDAVRGRFFVFTGAVIWRIEGPDLLKKTEIPAPFSVRGVGYDPTSDRLLVWKHTGEVEMFDGTTLASTGTFKVHEATSGGPWIRPGTGEAWFTHFVHCQKREFSHMPMRKNLGKCLDDPKTVNSFLTRYELPTGRLVETIQALGGKEGLGESGASFSGDGTQFFIADVSEGHLQAIGGKPTYLFQLQDIKGKPEYTWGEGWSLPSVNALDDDGDRVAGWSDSYYLTIFETKTGKKLWTAHLPGKHPY